MAPNPLSTAFVVQAHGLTAFSFALVFLLESFGLPLPLLSIASANGFAASQYAPAALIWVVLAIATFGTYETLFLPYVAKTQLASLKSMFCAYHLMWCVGAVYLALQPTALWNAWIPVLVVFSFTGWGFVSKADGGDPLF